MVYSSGVGSLWFRFLLKFLSFFFCDILMNYRFAFDLVSYSNYSSGVFGSVLPLKIHRTILYAVGIFNRPLQKK